MVGNKCGNHISFYLQGKRTFTFTIRTQIRGLYQGQDPRNESFQDKQGPWTYWERLHFHPIEPMAMKHLERNNSEAWWLHKNVRDLMIAGKRHPVDAPGSNHIHTEDGHGFWQTSQSYVFMDGSPLHWQVSCIIPSVLQRTRCTPDSGAMTNLGTFLFVCLFILQSLSLTHGIFHPSMYTYLSSVRHTEPERDLEFIEESGFTWLWGFSCPIHRVKPLKDVESSVPRIWIHEMDRRWMSLNPPISRSKLAIRVVISRSLKLSNMTIRWATKLSTTDSTMT